MTEREQIIAELVGRAGVMPREVKHGINFYIEEDIAALQAKHEAVVSEQALRYLALDTQFDEMVAEKEKQIEALKDDRDKWRGEATTAIAKLASLRQAIKDKGGDEHSPTQWAYDQVCKALQAERKES